MESESNTLRPSKGIPPGRKGVDPVAMRVRLAVRVAMDDDDDDDDGSGVIISDEGPPESAKAAWPLTYCFR